LRALAALLRRPIPREQLDSIAGCSNGPELIAELRRRGLGDDHLPCERIKFIDRDGNVCRPGVYSLTEKAAHGLCVDGKAQEWRCSMSAPMHPTMQQLADRAGVSRRLLFKLLPCIAMVALSWSRLRTMACWQ